MKVSQKTEYALKAMLELSLREDKSQTVRTAEIARNQHIPEKFLELILVELRRSGLIVSQRGPVGGHRLARDPAFITVGEIWRAIEGSIMDRTPGDSPPRGQVDPFRGIWEDVERSISNVVDKMNLIEVRKRAEARKAVPDYTI